jgi:hypothetical protein
LTALTSVRLTILHELLAEVLTFQHANEGVGHGPDAMGDILARFEETLLTP